MSELEWLLERKTLMKIALRGEDFKYIATLDSDPANEMTLEHLRDEELYSLANDPGEQRNLVSEDADRRDAFRELLADCLKTVHLSHIADQRIELDETTQKQLESLGYVYR